VCRPLAPGWASSAAESGNGRTLKCAVTIVSEFIVTTQVGWVPLQAPPQPSKADAGPVRAVSVTVAPGE